MAPLETLGFALAGYGCTTCIGNSGPARRADRAGDRGQRAGHRGRPVGQSQLRGPDPSPGPRELPRLAAARRRVRAGRAGGHRPHERAARHRRRRAAGLPRRRVALARRDPRGHPRRHRPGAVPGHVCERVRGRRPVAGAADPGRRPLRLGPPVNLRRPSAFLRWHVDGAAAGVRHRRRPLARDPRRLGHDGPHLPAGSIAPWSPAGEWLQERNVSPLEFNSYGARRGHHEVLVRGTFGNIRLRNALAGEREGPYGVHLPSGEPGFIYDIARRYRKEGVPLIVVAGREYGSGSSRDWAAKGPLLLGVRAVIAESFERIHRTNLVGMGILPLEFLPGENLAALGLDRTRVVHDPRRRGGAHAALATAGRRPRRRRPDDDLRRHLPHRRPDRARLLPQRRHPAGRAAAARAREGDLARPRRPAGPMSPVPPAGPGARGSAS